MGKSFKIKRSDEPPVEFNIELEQTDGTSVTETFHARPRIPGSLMLDLVASGNLESSYQAAALRQFFERAIVADDRERFIKTLDTAEPAIELPELSNIANWMIEQYGDRPTLSAVPS
jgi:hypothetical protein